MFRIKKGIIIYYRKFLKNNVVNADQIIVFEPKERIGYSGLTGSPSGFLRIS